MITNWTLIILQAASEETRTRRDNKIHGADQGLKYKLENLNIYCTAAVDNLLCMKNEGAQWSIVSYLKNQIKIKKHEKEKEKEKILGAVRDLPSNQHSQSRPIWVELGLIGCAD